MRFMLLIYSNEKNDHQPGSAGFDEMMAGYGAFTEEVTANGMMKAGDPLLPIATAKTARMRGNQAVISSGPFAETTEQLGGYYILDCKDIDEAAKYALKIPAAKQGGVEIRPIMEM